MKFFITVFSTILYITLSACALLQTDDGSSVQNELSELDKKCDSNDLHSIYQKLDKLRERSDADMNNIAVKRKFLVVFSKCKKQIASLLDADIIYTHAYKDYINACVTKNVAIIFEKSDLILATRPFISKAHSDQNENVDYMLGACNRFAFSNI